MMTGDDCGRWRHVCPPIFSTLSVGISMAVRPCVCAFSFFLHGPSSVRCPLAALQSGGRGWTQSYTYSLCLLEAAQCLMRYVRWVCWYDHISLTALDNFSNSKGILPLWGTRIIPLTCGARGQFTKGNIFWPSLPGMLLLRVQCVYNSHSCEPKLKWALAIKAECAVVCLSFFYHIFYLTFLPWFFWVFVQFQCTSILNKVELIPEFKFFLRRA